MEKITFTSALNGYMLAAGARRLSQDTLRDYTTTFHKFLDFINQVPPIDEITSEEVKAFLASKDQISKKTLLNYHIGLSALWTWCVDEDIVLEHIVRRLRRPKPEKKDIVPNTNAEGDAMLSVLSRSRSNNGPGTRESTHSLVTAERNRAVIYLLIDIGICYSEHFNLEFMQIDNKNRCIT